MRCRVLVTDTNLAIVKRLSDLDRKRFIESIFPGSKVTSTGDPIILVSSQ
jgi:hypothetical protein